MPRAPAGLHHGTGAVIALVAMLGGQAGAAAQTAGQAGPAAAPAPAELALTGRVEHPRTLTLADLQALPPTSVEVAHASNQGEQRASYTGALLWTLLGAAVPVDRDGPRTRLEHTLLARGRDGYAVALAMGELDPRMAGKEVVVAYARDGKPTPALQLVVPGGSHAGRSVRDLVAIEVR